MLFLLIKIEYKNKTKENGERMSLENVKDEIIRNAKDEAKKVLNNAKKDAKSIVKEAEAQATKVENAAKQDQKADETLKKNKGTVSIQLETKKLLFEKKKEIMQETYEKALKKLEGIDARKKKTIVTTLFNKASEQMKIATIYCNKKDAVLLKKKNIKTVANDAIQAGFIAENKNGTVRLDYTFATLFEGVRENTLQKVANMLF